MLDRTLPLEERDVGALPLHVVREGQGESVCHEARQWASAIGAEFDRGRLLPFPSTAGALAGVVAVVPQRDSVWDWAAMPLALPLRTYHLKESGEFNSNVVAEGWALGSYRPDAKRQAPGPRQPARLVWPEGADRARVRASVEATFFARDLINEPPNKLGPQELSDACTALFDQRGVSVRVLEERELTAQGYAGVLAVGAGSPRSPRVIDLRWGAPNHPRVTLVGKGVCFDTGGLNLKSEAGMRHMKKDMGGAAIVLGLAHMIVAQRLPVQLRVLIAAVENSTDGNAMRPGDVIYHPCWVDRRNREHRRGRACGDVRTARRSRRRVARIFSSMSRRSLLGHVKRSDRMSGLTSPRATPPPMHSSKLPAKSLIQCGDCRCTPRIESASTAKLPISSISQPTIRPAQSSPHSSWRISSPATGTGCILMCWME